MIKKKCRFIQIVAMAMTFVFMTGGFAEAYTSNSRILLRGTDGSELAQMQHLENVVTDNRGETIFVSAAINKEDKYTPAELELLARLVHAEAGGEPFVGQVAVAASVLNRVNSPKFPNTLPGVINQVVNGCYQYSPVLDGRINRPASDSARRAIEEALNGSDPSGGATGFYNPRKTSNWWVRTRPVVCVIGQHIFFR